MYTSANLLEEAYKSSASELIDLIGKVKVRLKFEGENVSLKNFFVEGGLIRFSKSKRIIVVGDIHGDLESLIFILKASNFLEEEEKESILLFLGDYGDRGAFSTEVYFVTLRLKTLFPDSIVLLRGNHEGPEDLMASPHDTPLRLKEKFGFEWEDVYRLLPDLWNTLPHAAVLESKYLFLHGGIPSEVKSLEEIAFARDYHPERRWLEEILWSDPTDGLEGTLFSPRGAGRIFGSDITGRFLKRIRVKTLIRGHEPCDGVKVNHDGRVLTVFSRKGSPYFNQHASYLIISGEAEALDGYRLAEEAILF